MADFENTPDIPPNDDELHHTELSGEPFVAADSVEAQRLRDIEATIDALRAAMQRQLEILGAAKRDHAFDDEYDAANSRVWELNNQLNQLRGTTNPDSSSNQ